MINGCILNCPINVDGIKRSVNIYGPDVVGLKGKSIRRTPAPIGVLSNMSLPPNILRHDKNTMVSMDYTFIHGLPHSHSTPRG